MVVSIGADPAGKVISFGLLEGFTVDVETSVVDSGNSPIARTEVKVTSLINNLWASNSSTI